MTPTTPNLTKGNYCFYLPATLKSPSGGYIPAIVVRNEPDFYVTDYDYGTNRALAQATVDMMNADLGLSKSDVLEIVTSSMFQKSRFN
jgi:hypothetical protein